MHELFIKGSRLQEYILLASLNPEDTVLIDINTGGGFLSTAFAFTESIKNCKAKVTAKLGMECDSAGTIIALACDDWIVNYFTCFMIHNIRCGTPYDGINVVESYMQRNQHINNIVLKIYEGFLTYGGMSTREMEAVATATCKFSAFVEKSTFSRTISFSFFK